LSRRNCATLPSAAERVHGTQLVRPLPMKSQKVRKPNRLHDLVDATANHRLSRWADVAVALGRMNVRSPRQRSTIGGGSRALKTPCRLRKPEVAVSAPQPPDGVARRRRSRLMAGRRRKRHRSQKPVISSGRGLRAGKAIPSQAILLHPISA